MDNEEFYVSVPLPQRAFVVFGLIYVLPSVLYFPDFLPSPEYTSMKINSVEYFCLNFCSLLVSESNIFFRIPNPGYFGHFLLYLREHHYSLVQLVFFGAWVLHLLEATCALVFCVYLGVGGRNTVRWVADTVLYGGFSLRHLIR